MVSVISCSSYHPQISVNLSGKSGFNVIHVIHLYLQSMARNLIDLLIILQ